MYFFRCLLFVGVAASPASAATITNGGFDDGLNGHTVEAVAAAVPATELATVATAPSGNTYLSLEARPQTGGFGVSASQMLTIDASAPILSFDAALLSEEQVLAGLPANLDDTFSASITPDGGGSTTILFQFDNGLAPAGNFTSFTDAPESVFGPSLGAFSVIADLSAFSGQSVSLSFSGFNFETVLTQSFFGVDNIALSALDDSVSEVPLPLSAGLLLTGLFAFGTLRRR